MNKTAEHPTQRVTTHGSGHPAVVQMGRARGRRLGLARAGWAGPDERSTEEAALQASDACGRHTRAPTAACPITVSIASRDAGFVERMGTEVAHHDSLSLLGPRWDAGRSRVADLMQMAQAHVLVVDADIVAPLADKPEFQLRYGAALSNLILVVKEDSPDVVDVVLATRSRGCVTTDCDAASFARAVRAVAVGELWLPRWILSALYQRATGASVEKPESRHKDPEADRLTARESDALALARTGLTNKQIGLQMHISASTVKKHLAAALAKCGMFRRRQLLP